MKQVCENNWLDKKSSETNSKHFIVYPSKDDKNRNNSGGNHNQGSLRTVTPNSNSFCFFSSEDQGNCR